MPGNERSDQILKDDVDDAFIRGILSYLEARRADKLEGG